MYKFISKRTISSIVNLHNKPSLNVRNLNKLFKHNLNFARSRNLHLNQIQNAKVFIDTENNFVFKQISKYEELTDSKQSANNNTIKDVTEFEKVLNANWRESNATDIANAFINAQSFCIDNDIPLSDPRFDQLVDGLMDHCQDLNPQQLYDLLICVSNYPECESFNSHNFHDVWSCLDDMCCWRMHNWDIPTQFKFADIWYKMRLARMCDYIHEIIDRSKKRAERLSKDELVRIFFYFNLMRHRSIDFEYEYALEKQIQHMNIDDMAIVALGYFKTKSKIKIDSIMSCMIKKVMAERRTIHEITLTAILKGLRYSKPGKIHKEVSLMLDTLVPEIDRLSSFSCLHLSLVGTGIALFHKESLEKSSQKLAQVLRNPEEFRLKDIERLLNALTMFDFNPKTDPDIFKVAFEELHNKEREPEVVKYPRCIASALHYLSLRNIYSNELMNKVLDNDFISDTYGKGVKALPRELFSLDCCIEIECPDYEGNRLSPLIKYKAVKYLTEWIPRKTEDKKPSATDLLFINCVDTVEAIVKDEKFVIVNHVLPHFARADIILCKNKLTGEYIEPLGFENTILGDVKRPLKDDNFIWYAVVAVGWNNTIRDSSLVLGNVTMKERQLKKIGYHPVFVIWNQFLNLSTQDRIHYLSSKLI